jgi:hypothetical protein
MDKERKKLKCDFFQTIKIDTLAISDGYEHTLTPVDKIENETAMR